MSTDGTGPTRGTAEQPPWPRLVLRALARRCPVCGARGVFEGWFRLRERCTRCHLRFQRQEGHWTGDVGVNTIVSFGALFVVLLVGALAGWPIGVLAVAALAVGLVVPVLFFPFSKTLWLVVDLVMRPLEPGEADVVAP